VVTLGRIPGPLRHAATALFIVAGITTAGRPAGAETIRVASTTSTENSGLLDAIIPQFTEATGIAIDVEFPRLKSRHARRQRVVTRGKITDFEIAGESATNEIIFVDTNQVFVADVPIVHGDGEI